MLLNKIISAFKAKPVKKHVKILVIEDSEVDQKLAAVAIEQGGYTSLRAYDGQTGFAMAQEHLPDLIILDYNLPDIKGPEVCKRLKLHPGTQKIPVLFLTTMDTPESIMNCYEEGGENYLSKPISIKFLLQQINLILKDKSKD